MPRTLDRTRPFAEIWGRDDAIPYGAKYQQNNLYFDHEGKCLSPDSDYRPADTRDLLSDKDKEIARLRAELDQRNTPDPQKPDAAQSTLDRGAIVKKLTDMGVTFQKNAPTDKLYAILQAELDKAA